MLDRELRVVKISKDAYENSGLKHIFFTGDLKKEVSHPFVKDKRVEFILCLYNKGDHGDYHWHPDVDEYEIVIEGRIGYKNAFTGETVWFKKGDFSYIPAGLCVRRIVMEKSMTVAIKLPSKDEKVTCNVCSYREQCPIGGGVDDL